MAANSALPRRIIKVRDETAVSPTGLHRRSSPGHPRVISVNLSAFSRRVFFGRRYTRTGNLLWAKATRVFFFIFASPWLTPALLRRLSSCPSSPAVTPTGDPAVVE